MTATESMCDGGDKETEKIGYCPMCWGLVCEECYDEYAGLCIDCSQHSFSKS